MSTPDTSELSVTISPWPHRMAWVLCVATFPLLWIGGLITSTDAGMAVPDWPGTYGYNMFLYPWQTWMFGPWDLFIEHGHRLFASGVGMLTIIFLVVVYWNDRRRWLRRLAILALLMVISQGALGGMRVLLNARLVGMLHGCLGPTFFALTTMLVCLTSPRRSPEATWPRWYQLWLPMLIFIQLTLGASMRHVPEASKFVTFATHVLAHLTMAAVVLVSILLVAYRTRQTATGLASRWLAWALTLGVLLQISLGFASWFVKYRLPGWFPAWISDEGAPLHWAQSLMPGTLTASVAGGWAETHIVTAHSALGSLLLALATAIAFTRCGEKSLGNVSPDTVPVTSPTNDPPVVDASSNSNSTKR